MWVLIILLDSPTAVPTRVGFKTETECVQTMDKINMTTILKKYKLVECKELK